MPRLLHDAYMTPPHYVAALLSEVNVFGRVYEPCAGDGAIAEPLRKLSRVRKVITNDLDEACKTDTHYDSTSEIEAALNLDWIITNPPFSDALSVIEMMQPHAPNAAFLARLSFLEPTEDREYFLSQHPPTQVLVLPRHSFRCNDEGKRQTDNVTCAWLVWHADQQPRPMKFYSRARAQALAIMQGLIDG